MFYSNENNLTFEEVIYDEIKKGNIQIKAETLDNLLQAISRENKNVFDKAYNQGFDKGFDEGHQKGFDSGFDEGYRKGYDDNSIF